MVGAGGLKKVISLPLDVKEKEILKEKVAQLDATYEALEIR